MDACLTGIGWCHVGFSDYHDPDLSKRRGRVLVKRVNPLDLYPEDGIGEIDEATYYVRRGLYSVRWLEKLFKGKEWKPDVGETVFLRRGLSTRARTTQATLYEVLDLVESKVYLISPQHQKILAKTDYPYQYFEGPMYIPLLFV